MCLRHTLPLCVSFHLLSVSLSLSHLLLQFPFLICHRALIIPPGGPSTSTLQGKAESASTSDVAQKAKPEPGPQSHNTPATGGGQLKNFKIPKKSAQPSRVGTASEKGSKEVHGSHSKRGRLGSSSSAPQSHSSPGSGSHHSKHSSHRHKPHSASRKRFERALNKTSALHTSVERSSNQTRGSEKRSNREGVHLNPSQSQHQPSSISSSSPVSAISSRDRRRRDRPSNYHRDNESAADRSRERSRSPRRRNRNDGDDESATSSSRRHGYRTRASVQSPTSKCFSPLSTLFMQLPYFSIEHFHTFLGLSPFIYLGP